MAELSFRALMADLRSGGETAAEEIVSEYTAALVAVARRQIGPQLAQRLDPEDIVQSTYRSLFVRMRQGEYELGSGRDLWKLLVTMTLNKVRRQAKFHSAQRRDVHLEAAGTLPLADDANANGPSPSEAAELIDEVQALLADLHDRDRPIVELRLQGYSTAEIAEQTGRAERSIRRVLEQIRRRLEHSIAE